MVRSTFCHAMFGCWNMAFKSKTKRHSEYCRQKSYRYWRVFKTSLSTETMIEKPFHENLSRSPEYRQSVNFFMKTFYRLRRMRELELDLGVAENEMQSTKLVKYLEKWKIKKTKDMEDHGRRRIC